MNKTEIALSSYKAVREVTKQNFVEPYMIFKLAAVLPEENYPVLLKMLMFVQDAAHLRRSLRLEEEELQKFLIPEPI